MAHNRVIIQGRLTGTPLVGSTQSGKAVTNFSVAVNRRFDKEKTDFFKVVAWKKTAEFICKYFDKGQEILIEGRLENNKWQDENGNNRDSWELVAEQVCFCGPKQQNETIDDISDVFNTGTNEDLPF